MQEAIVVSEAAGKLSFGKQGRTTHSTSDMYTCVTLWWVELKSSKAALLMVKWPKWSQLSKRDLNLVLSQLSCNPEAEIGLDSKEWSIHTVLPCLKKSLRWRISTFGLAGLFSDGALTRLMLLSQKF